MLTHQPYAQQKKLAPMLESFFVQYIVPEFKSPHGFLRSRACDLVEKYESVDMVWADQNVGLSLHLSEVLLDGRAEILSVDTGLTIPFAGLETHRPSRTRSTA